MSFCLLFFSHFRISRCECDTRQATDLHGRGENPAGNHQGNLEHLVERKRHECFVDMQLHPCLVQFKMVSKCLGKPMTICFHPLSCFPHSSVPFDPVDLKGKLE